MATLEMSLTLSGTIISFGDMAVGDVLVENIDGNVGDVINIIRNNHIIW